MPNNKWIWFGLGIIFILFVWPMVAGLLGGSRKVEKAAA